MRSLTQSLLLALSALVFAGTASGHTISAVETSTGPYAPSDTLVVDIWLDSEGEAFFGFALYVVSDPAVLSGDPIASVRHPIPGEEEEYSQFYYYPGYWYISSISNTPIGPVNQSIATLVFHVISPPTSTWVVPSFDYGPWGVFVGVGPGPPIEPVDVTGLVLLQALHIPEPTTTVLLGLGLLSILWAGRHR